MIVATRHTYQKTMCNTQTEEMFSILYNNVKPMLRQYFILLDPDSCDVKVQSPNPDYLLGGATHVCTAKPGKEKKAHNKTSKETSRKVMFSAEKDGVSPAIRVKEDSPKTSTIQVSESIVYTQCMMTFKSRHARLHFFYLLDYCYKLQVWSYGLVI